MEATIAETKIYDGAQSAVRSSESNLIKQSIDDFIGGIRTDV